MAQLPLHDDRGKKVEDVEVSEAAFGYPLKKHLLYEAVRHYLAVGRSGTHKAKLRHEVSGGGRKPWKQKGTGRARHGSTRSPLWRKGGTVHGPLPRDYSYAFPKLARRRALASALSEKGRQGELVLVDALQLDDHKTKSVVTKVREGLKIEGKVLLVYDGENPNLELAVRNRPDMDATRALQLHAYNVLDCDVVVMTRAAADEIGEVMSR